MEYGLRRVGVATGELALFRANCVGEAKADVRRYNKKCKNARNIDKSIQKICMFTKKNVTLQADYSEAIH